MEVDIRLPHMAFPSCYSKQDICSEINTHKLSHALVSFLPKYSHDKQGRKDLYADISKADIAGGDRLLLWGKGCGKNQVMYIRCQCSIVYRGNKVDKESGSIIQRSDYRNDCIKLTLY